MGGFLHAWYCLRAPLQCVLKNLSVVWGGENTLEKQHGATCDHFLRRPCRSGTVPQSTTANLPSQPRFFTQSCIVGSFDLLRRRLVALAEPKHESEIVHVFRDQVFHPAFKCSIKQWDRAAFCFGKKHLSFLFQYAALNLAAINCCQITNNLKPQVIFFTSALCRGRKQQCC